MAIADLERDLLWRKRALDLRSSFWRALVLWPIITGIVLMAVSLWLIFDPDLPYSASYPYYILNVVYGMIVTLMLAWVYRFVYAETHLEKIRNVIAPLPPAFQAKIDTVLTPLTAKTKIKEGSVILHYASGDFSGSPSVIESGARTHLIVPKGFIKILCKDRACAEAMLAHELGHVKHRDSKLLLTTTASAKIMLCVSIPLNLAIALFIAVTYPIGSPAFPFRTDNDAASFYFVLALANTAILTFGYFVLRSFRHDAELLADAFACVHSDVDGVDMFLTANSTDTRFNPLSVHPGLDARRRNVRRCRALLDKPDRQRPGFLGSAQKARP